MEINKEFILVHLLKYKNDTSLCGFNEEEGCQCFTKDGKNCVIGSLMKPEAESLVDSSASFYSLVNYGAYSVDLSLIFKEEYLPIVQDEDNMEILGAMQDYHDSLIGTSKVFINEMVDKLEEVTGFNLNELRYEI